MRGRQEGSARWSRALRGRGYLRQHCGLGSIVTGSGPKRVRGLLTVAALAGCGGGEDTRKDTAQTAKTVSATPTPTPSPAPDRAEDKRIDEASQLKLDLPAGRSPTPTSQKRLTARRSAASR
jgi:hypothetical protein